MVEIATLAITIAAGGNAGGTLRKLAARIEQAAGDMPSVNSSGASVVLTIDNAPSVGVATVQVTGGPYQSSLLSV